tara:strand:+ start:956 stop:1291 length:336 start_codon:yes stop_codon:yes gene_type:complete
MSSIGITNIEEVGFDEPRGWAPEKREFTIFRQDDEENDQEIYGNPAYQEEFEEDKDSDEDIDDDMSEFDDSASEMSDVSIKTKKPKIKDLKIIQGIIPVRILREETDFFPE